MNCDAIANAYRWFEYAAFGGQLEKHRFAFLEEAADRKRALLIGDGDGRFLVRLAAANRNVQIDSIELSSGMIDAATRRLRRADLYDPARIRLIHGDVRAIDLTATSYDLIVTNFLLDCLSASDVARLAGRICRSCASNANWIICEFQQPERGWKAWHARVWLKTMYLFFGLTTGLETQSLPPYERSLRAAGFALTAKQDGKASLIRSELWSLTAPPSES